MIGSGPIHLCERLWLYLLQCAVYFLLFSVVFAGFSAEALKSRVLDGRLWFLYKHARMCTCRHMHTGYVVAVTILLFPNRHN